MTTSALSNARFNFFSFETVCLHRVSGLERLVALDGDATFLPGRHLANVFLEMLERADPAFVDLLLPPDQLDPASTADLALQHPAAGDDSEPRDLDRGDDLDLALADLAVGRLAQALGGAFDILRQLVDDVVVADLDLGAFRGGR